MPAEPRVVRCAIYTRKSTEEGLEQEFNSLDAQREACAAYVLSQKHEGWQLLPETYDDGGFSGGNMERPGLVRLLGEVRAGRVDVIVVYKVDRLTRSLADFAKIVEVLDGAGASFVSVTQAFNTTTSMGRLTLNVLLSFAQFEREVTGERIRDKIAASKRKGLWMGGPVPLGYVVKDRRLVVEPEEAERVRSIFRCYLEHGSATPVMAALKRQGIVTKVQHRTSGPHRGGIPFARGSLYKLLRNRIYLGEIIHKGQCFPGEHEAIVPADLWQAVQDALDASVRRHKRREGANQRSALMGLLRDALGRPMSPSHSTKGGKRYRYYHTHKDHVTADQPAMRVPAHDLEAIVAKRLAAWLNDAGAVCNELGEGLDAHGTQRLLERASTEAARLEDPAKLREPFLDQIREVRVLADKVQVAVRLAALGGPEGAITTLERPFYQVRQGHEIRLVIEPPKPDTPEVDDSEVRAIARAIVVREQLLASGQTVSEFARNIRQCRGHITELVKLSYMPPPMVRSVVEGGLVRCR